MDGQNCIMQFFQLIFEELYLNTFGYGLPNFITRDRQLRLKPALVHDTDYMIEKTYHLPEAYHI